MKGYMGLMILFFASSGGLLIGLKHPLLALVPSLIAAAIAGWIDSEAQEQRS